MTPALSIDDAVRWLASLPPDSADCLLTDPPYCSGGFSEQGKRASTGMLGSTQKGEWFTGDNMGTAGLAFLLRAVAVEARRVLRDGSSALFFTDWRMVAHLGPALESAGLRHQNTLVWDKGTPGTGTGFRAQHEMILLLAKGTPTYHRHDLGNVISCPRVPGVRKHHPTEKPVALLRRLLAVVCPPKGTVLDPFLGSGATALAAASLGLRCLGCDLEQTYVTVARERLETAERQGALFEDLDQKETPEP